MMEVGEIYRCGVCGKIVEILHVGAGRMECCGKPMEKLQPVMGGEGETKHMPVVESKGDTLSVRFGSIEHPMEENHLITLIEVITKDNLIMRRFLSPHDSPEAEFPVADPVEVRGLCNLHGLWVKNLQK